LATIDFSRSGFGPHTPGPWRPIGTGGATADERCLVECAYFVLCEQRLSGIVEQPTRGTCALVTCVAGQGILSTSAGQVALTPLQTVLVPADAEWWRVDIATGSADLLVALPRFQARPPIP
jgi:mannose-6-phosphate isomerase class I